MTTETVALRPEVGCQGTSKKGGHGRPAPAVRTAADVVAEPVRWLWKDHFALGKIAVVAGVGNVGKSLLVAGDFAARVSSGSTWPDGSASPAGDVLIASGHDSAADTLVPRLCDHGADLKRVHLLEDVTGPTGEPSRAFVLGGLLDRGLRQCPGVKLVVIDPLSAFLNAASSRAGLAVLQGLASRCGAAFVLVTELRESAAAKAAATGSGPPAVTGLPGLVSAARSVWVLSCDADDPLRRLFMPAKNNLGTLARGYAWRLADGKVQWEPKRMERAGAGRMAADPARARRLAAAFIADFLKDGPRMWGVIEAHAKRAGHKPAALERGRGGVAEPFKRTEVDGRWLWRLIGDDRTSSDGDIADLFGGDEVGLPSRSGGGTRRQPTRAAQVEPDDEDDDDDDFAETDDDEDDQEDCDEIDDDGDDDAEDDEDDADDEEDDE